jgi:hypothetical protein
MSKSLFTMLFCVGAFGILGCGMDQADKASTHLDESNNDNTLAELLKQREKSWPIKRKIGKLASGNTNRLFA